MRNALSKRLDRFGISIWPYNCVFLVLCSWFLFRVSVFLWAEAARCIPLHEFYFSPWQGNWPLGGVFFLIFFLLGALHVVLLLGPYGRRRGDKFILLAGLSTLLVVLASSQRLAEEANVTYHKDNNIYGDWLAFDHGWEMLTDDCRIAKGYVGKWKVVEQYTPWPGNQFPMQWIEFRGSLTFRAADSRWEKIYEGRWRPNNRRYLQTYGEIYGDVWLFDLDGDTLILTIPEFVANMPTSRVVLKRMTDSEAKEVDGAFR